MCKYCVNHKKYDDDVEEKFIISKAVRTFFGSIYFDQYIGQGNELKFVFTADSEAKLLPNVWEKSQSVIINNNIQKGVKNYDP